MILLSYKSQLQVLKYVILASLLVLLVSIHHLDYFSTIIYSTSSTLDNFQKYLHRWSEVDQRWTYAPPLHAKRTSDPPESTTQIYRKISILKNKTIDQYNSNVTINQHYQSAYGSTIDKCKYKSKGKKSKLSKSHKFKQRSRCNSERNGTGPGKLYFEDLPFEGVNPTDDLLQDDYKQYSKIKEPLKKILYWNEAYNQNHFGFGYGREPFRKAGCREDRCFATSVRSAFPYKEFDAVIWHLRSSDRSFPPERSPHTRYVLWMVESATYTFANMSQYNNVFNWTFTYRLDSDFPNPYGLVLPKQHKKKKQQIVSMKHKTKMAAWFVSNCRTDSLREVLTQTLNKYIDIDVYGGCGTLVCGKKKKQDCYEMLQKNYKFYLSFENSLCTDYVTEKFFNILKYNVVPVVYSLGRFSEIAPPHSYIDVLDFPDVKSLADHLIYLHHNDTAYLEYFRWKSNYGMVKGWSLGSVPWCSLCERLHTDHSSSIYEDIEDWFIKQSKCKHKTNDRNLSRFVHGL